MNIKRILVYITAFILIFGSFLTYSNRVVHAEDASVVIGLTPNGEVNVGDTVTATVIIKGDTIANYTIYLEYTTGVLENQSGEDTGSIAISGTSMGTVSYTFKAVAEGRASISTSGYEVYDAEGNQLSIAHAGANVTVGTVETNEETYQIGTEVYTLVNEYHLPDPPEGYTLSSVNFHDREIFAYQAPNQHIKVICLQNVEGEQKWFIFDEETQDFSPFIEYSLQGVKYVIINKPDDVELPAGFTETSLTLDKTQFTAYTDGLETGLYLVYALNVRGEAHFYYYDTEEGGFTRYEAIKAMMGSGGNVTATALDADQSVKDASQQDQKQVKYATPLIADKKDSSDDDEGLVSRETLKRLLMMMIILFIVMCIVVIILVIRSSILQSQIDDMIEEAEGMPETTVLHSESDIGEDLYNKAVRDARMKVSRNKGYAVNEDTGEILLEEAADNNSGVNVPPAEDKVINKVEDAMKEKPFGIDSAFNVASPEEMPRGEHVYVEKEKDPEVVNQEMVDKVRKEKKEKLEAEEKAYNERISKYDASEAETEVLTQESQQSVLQKMQAIRYEDAMDQYLTGGGQYPDPSEADQDESDEDEDNTSFFRKKKKNRKRNKKNKKDNKSSDNNQNADKQKKQQSDQQSVQNDINNTQANQEAEKTKVVLPGAGDEEE